MSNSIQISGCGHPWALNAHFSLFLSLITTLILYFHNHLSLSLSLSVSLSLSPLIISFNNIYSHKIYATIMKINSIIRICWRPAKSSCFHSEEHTVLYDLHKTNRIITTLFYFSIIINDKRRSTVKAANRKLISFMSFENITFIYRAFQVWAWPFLDKLTTSKSTYLGWPILFLNWSHDVSVTWYS